MLNAGEGYSTDLWTSSVCAFTALVVTVNVNLLFRIKYFTKLHLVCFLLCSFSFYIGFMWATNYTQYAWTQHAVYEAHVSLQFYFILAVTIGFCLALDMLLESYKVLIKTSPTDFLRLVVSRKQSIYTPDNKARFE